MGTGRNSCIRKCAPLSSCAFTREDSTSLCFAWKAPNRYFFSPWTKVFCHLRMNRSTCFCSSKYCCISKGCTLQLLHDDQPFRNINLQHTENVNFQHICAFGLLLSYFLFYFGSSHLMCGAFFTLPVFGFFPPVYGCVFFFLFVFSFWLVNQPSVFNPCVFPLLCQFVCFPQFVSVCVSCVPALCSPSVCGLFLVLYS